MNPEKRTRMYLTAAVMGLVATVLLTFATALDWPDFFRGLTFGVLLVSVVLLLLRRFRDEYIQQLWNGGTSFAFAAVVVVFVFAPLIEGIANGFSNASPGQAITSNAIGLAALLAFFVGFHLKWLRSSS